MVPGRACQLQLENTFIIANSHPSSSINNLVIEHALLSFFGTSSPGEPVRVFPIDD
jgi:hypothetical protein